MKAKLFAVTALVGAMFFTQTATAQSGRSISAADRAVQKRMIVHVTKFVTILEKGAKQPRAALKDLSRYIDKNLKDLRALTDLEKKIKRELSPSERSRWNKTFQKDPVFGRMTKAVGNFIKNAPEDVQKGFTMQMQRLSTKKKKTKKARK